MLYSLKTILPTFPVGFHQRGGIICFNYFFLVILFVFIRIQAFGVRNQVLTTLDPQDPAEWSASVRCPTMMCQNEQSWASGWIPRAIALFKGIIRACEQWPKVICNFFPSPSPHPTPTSHNEAGVWGIRVGLGGKPLPERQGEDALPDRGRGVLQLPPGLGRV